MVLTEYFDKSFCLLFGLRSSLDLGGGAVPNVALVLSYRKYTKIYSTT